MNGNDFYINKIENKIDTLLEKNVNKQYLVGFRYYIGNLAPSTIYDYLLYVNNFIEYCQKNPNELTLNDYTFYLGTLKKMTSSYQIAVFAALKNFSKYLAASKINLDDTMQYIARPKFKETEKTRVKRENGFLNQNELNIYLQNIKNGMGSCLAKERQVQWKERDYAIIMIFIQTGIRCSALYKLDVGDLNFDKKTFITTDKGHKVKEYFLSDNLIEIIKEWLKKREEITKSKPLPTDPLFISNQKTRISQSAISRLVHKYALNINGKNITPHKLRATYGTMLYNATKDIYFVQKCMNHTSVATTEKYIRGQVNQTEQASNIMANICQ